MKAIQVEAGEWLYKGCYIQESEHPKLVGKYEVFKNDEKQTHVGRCNTFVEAEKLCEENELEIQIPVDNNSVPTKWAKIEEIETWVGGKTYEGKGGRAKLIVVHYCGNNKEDLIDQLETLIYGLKNGFDSFAS